MREKTDYLQGVNNDDVDKKAVLKDTNEDLIKSYFELCVKKLRVNNTERELTTHFWWQTVLDRQVGCVQQCMLEQQGLVDSQGAPLYSAVQDFITKHGGDVMVSTTIVNTVRACRTYPRIGDKCEDTMLLADCFKKTLHKLHWNPAD